MSSDSYPATLGRGPPSRVDDAHRLEAVPAVAAWTRFTADAREEMSRLFHVHVVELAAEWIDLPAIRRRIEHADLVLESPPLDDTLLDHDLEVAVHIPREEIHVDVPDRARGEAHGEVGEIVGRDLKARDALDRSAHLHHLAEKPAHVVDRVALVEEAPAALLDVRHVEAPIVLAWVSGGEVVGVLGASRMHRA